MFLFQLQKSYSIEETMKYHKRNFGQDNQYHDRDSYPKYKSNSTTITLTCPAKTQTMTQIGIN